MASLFVSFLLSMMLIYMGAVPTFACCAGEDHDGQPGGDVASEHCGASPTHIHENDEHKDCFCPHEGCGPEDCVDIVLTWAAPPPSREGSAVAPPAEIPAVAAADIEVAGACPLIYPGGPPGSSISQADQTCILII